MKSDVKAALIGVEFGGAGRCCSQTSWRHPPPEILGSCCGPTATQPRPGSKSQPESRIPPLRAWGGDCRVWMGPHRRLHLPLWFSLVLLLLLLLQKCHQLFHPPVYPVCFLNSPSLPAFPWMGGHRAEGKRPSLEVFAKDKGQEPV